MRIPIFPLAGTILFPRLQLPLHIFEQRYQALVRDALASDRLMGMIQPRGNEEPPHLYDVGCLGEITGWEELDDGRFHIVLEGISRFRIAREVSADTPYRQIDADMSGFSDEIEPEPLSSIQRADLEREARRYADALGYAIDWKAVGTLDDEILVNGMSQITPTDPGSKQILLEAPDLATRADLLVQIMQFQRLAPNGGEGPETIQ